jgi:hypothetical protein
MTAVERLNTRWPSGARTLPHHSCSSLTQKSSVPAAGGAPEMYQRVA